MVVLVVVLLWSSFCTWDAAAPPTPEVGRVADPAQYRPDIFDGAGFLSSACRAEPLESLSSAELRSICAAQAPVIIHPCGRDCSPSNLSSVPDERSS